ncbi:DUF4270 domain-containing protein [Flavobacterium sp. LMO8]|uniref:DUF4270 domain-containing protein n=1 Tax=Flavobacterium sp. LMO8 TaxID=2654244 RepID=UPI0013967DDD|nr:DUF4270 domain-containing protein [Flavobacterium sp. LMO8]
MGSDLVDDSHFNLEEVEVENLKSYSIATQSVQSNNLPINALGIYKDPYFGTSKAHFVSQVELSNSNPTIGDTPVIDSVYLYVPYFSTLESTTDSGERIYELDSVYGYDENAKFKLHVYENGYFIRDFDPSTNFQSSQKYYTNGKSIIDPFKGTELLNNSPNLAQNDEFFISNKELYIYKTNGSGLYVDSAGDVLANQSDVSLRVIKERKTPGIWLDLKNSFFQQKILDAAASGVLYNNNIFKDYFRGLLFEVQEITPGQGSMAMLDFSTAEFKIIFKSSIGGGDMLRRTLSLQMGYSSTSSKKSNSINFLEHTKSLDYNAALNASNQLTGDDKLFIKGGDGSLAFIDVFDLDEDNLTLTDDGELIGSDLLPEPNLVPDDLDRLRSNMKLNKWLVNEANLVFYTENSIMSATDIVEPQRIYIFDATNDKPIIDYYSDPSTNNSDIKKNKTSFGGLIAEVKDENGDVIGTKYSFRITEYIKRLLINEDTSNNTNLRIGVSVTESININTNAYINPDNTQPIVINGDIVEFLPVASVMNPLGTVLHGPSSTATYVDEKGNVVPMKLRLRIYFTKPN